MKSLPSTPSIDARVMRAIGAIAKSPSVSAGSMSWRRAAHASAPSWARTASTTKKPVTARGAVENASSRPSGAGAHPSRK